MNAFCEIVADRHIFGVSARFTTASLRTEFAFAKDCSGFCPRLANKYNIHTIVILLAGQSAILKNNGKD